MKKGVKRTLQEDIRLEMSHNLDKRVTGVKDDSLLLLKAAWLSKDTLC